MKIIASIAVLALSLCSALAAPPQELPGFTGELIKAYALTQVDKFQVVAYEWGKDGNRHKLDGMDMPITPVRSLDDLNEQLSQSDIKFTLDDPRGTVEIEAKLLSGGKLAFESFSSFQLEKEHSIKTGKVSYVVPWWATSLNFQFKGVDIPVEGAVHAYAVSDNGSVSNLTVVDGLIHIGDGDYWQSYGGTLEVFFRDGTSARYDHAGRILEPAGVEMRFGSQGRAHVDGIIHALPYEGVLDVQTVPEWKHNPAFETMVPENGCFQLYAESYNGFQPMYVHVTSWDDLAEGLPSTVVPYHPGMWIQFTPEVLFLIWLEFHPNVVGSGSHDDGHDKG